MESQSIHNLLKCLISTPQRPQILAVLDDKGTDLRDLMDELNSPRSTLQRNLATLEDHGWIKNTSSGYVLTPTGAHIFDMYSTMEQRIEKSNQLGHSYALSTIL